MREELALIHIKVVEAVTQTDTEKKKKEHARQAERAASEELDAILERRQPNTSAFYLCPSP